MIGNGALNGDLMGMEGMNELSPLYQTNGSSKVNANNSLANQVSGFASKDKQQQSGQLMTALQGALGLGLRAGLSQAKPTKSSNAFEEQNEKPSLTISKKMSEDISKKAVPQEEPTLRRMRIIKFKRLNESEAPANDGGKQPKTSISKRPGGL